MKIKNICENNTENLHLHSTYKEILQTIGHST